MKPMEPYSEPCSYANPHGGGFLLPAKKDLFDPEDCCEAWRIFLKTCASILKVPLRPKFSLQSIGPQSVRIFSVQNVLYGCISPEDWAYDEAEKSVFWPLFLQSFAHAWSEVIEEAGVMDQKSAMIRIIHRVSAGKNMFESSLAQASCNRFQ